MWKMWLSRYGSGRFKTAYDLRNWKWVATSCNGIYVLISSIMVGEVDATTASGIHGLADENEDIRVHVVSREQAYQWVEEGKIDNAASVIALQWLQLHHQALKNEWA